MIVTAKREDCQISMRLPGGDIAIIDRVANLRGSSRTDFVRDAAVRAADEIFMESALVCLSPEGRVRASRFRARRARAGNGRIPSSQGAVGDGGGGKALRAEPSLSAPELLNASLDASQFSRGKTSLGNWLKTRVPANQQRGVVVVMVAHVAGRGGGAATAWRPSPSCLLPCRARSAPASHRTRRRAFCSGTSRQITPGLGKGLAWDCSTTRWPAG